MSAERLREAAALMRERAERAHWVDFGNKSDWPGQVATLDSEDEDRDHIVGMSPTVALAVADWLDAEADVFTDWSDGLHGQASILPSRFSRALKVANAYLGGTP